MNEYFFFELKKLCDSVLKQPSLENAKKLCDELEKSSKTSHSIPVAASEVILVPILMTIGDLSVR